MCISVRFGKDSSIVKMASSCSLADENCDLYLVIALCPKMQIRREVALHEMFLFVGIEVLY